MKLQLRACACLACALASILSAPRSRAADACDALYHAGIKSVQTPHRAQSTMTGRNGKTRTGEAVYAGGVEYLQLDGKWTRSPTPQQDMIEAAREKLKTHPDVCTFVGERIEGGQTVSVYDARSREFGTDQQVRILESSGLVQGATTKLPDGSVIEMRYEYGDVAAPVLPH